MKLARPPRIIKFDTSLGAVYIDLEQVASVCSCMNPVHGHCFAIYLRGSTQTIYLDMSYAKDLNRSMGAWMEYKNSL